MSKDISKLKKDVWSLLSKYIRNKYAVNGYDTCYTCGKVYPIKKSQCGHGIGGRGNAILFDEQLLRPQCYGCNIMKGGNYDVFHAKLIEEHGLAWMKKKWALSKTVKQFTITELTALKEHYKEKLNNHD
jgi:hypothetical protein